MLYHKLHWGASPAPPLFEPPLVKNDSDY